LDVSTVGRHPTPTEHACREALLNARHDAAVGLVIGGEIYSQGRDHLIIKELKISHLNIVEAYLA
jgi:hypothetical protein